MVTQKDTQKESSQTASESPVDSTVAELFARKFPAEIRSEIFKHVLSTNIYHDRLLYFPQDATIGRVPPVVTVFPQFKDELLEIYFEHRTVWFHSLSELGSALLLAISTVPY